MSKSKSESKPKTKSLSISGRLPTVENVMAYEAIASKYNLSKSALTVDLATQVADKNYTPKVPLTDLLSHSDIFKAVKENFNIQPNDFRAFIDEQNGITGQLKEVMEDMKSNKAKGEPIEAKEADKSDPKDEPKGEPAETIEEAEEDIIATVQQELAAQKTNTPNKKGWVKIVIGVVVVAIGYYVWTNHRDKIPFLKSKANVPSIE